MKLVVAIFIFALVGCSSKQQMPNRVISSEEKTSYVVKIVNVSNSWDCSLPNNRNQLQCSCSHDPAYYFLTSDSQTATNNSKSAITLKNQYYYIDYMKPTYNHRLISEHYSRYKQSCEESINVGTTDEEIIRRARDITDEAIANSASRIKNNMISDPEVVNSIAERVRQILENQASDKK